MTRSAGTSNQSTDHQHVYELKGGPTWWAECAVMVDGLPLIGPDGRETIRPIQRCGLKFNRGNGVVCGSQAKVLEALRE